MMPSHKVFHTVLFIVAINFLFGCPKCKCLYWEQSATKLQRGFSNGIKKKYCQAHFKQDISPSPVLNLAQTLFLAPASDHLLIRAAQHQGTDCALFTTSMRLNLWFCNELPGCLLNQFPLWFAACDKAQIRIWKRAKFSGEAPKHFFYSISVHAVALDPSNRSAGSSMFVQKV